MKVEPVYAEIGARIKAARKSAGLSQDDVAEFLGVSGAAVCQIEKGQIRVSVKSICEIAAIVDATPEALIGLPLGTMRPPRNGYCVPLRQGVS